MSGDANLAYRAAKANRSAALAAALPVLVKHQFRWSMVHEGALSVRCSCGVHVAVAYPDGRPGDSNPDEERLADAAMAQHQIDAVRGGIA